MDPYMFDDLGKVMLRLAAVAAIVLVIAATGVGFLLGRIAG